VTDNIFGFLWAKIALGAIYFATATTDSDVTDLYAEARYRTLFGRLAGEVVAVADARGVRLETFDGFDRNGVPAGPAQDPAAIAATWDGQNQYWNSHENKRTGVWRDLAIHKRKTEIDRLIGPVIAIGRERGVATPGLSRLVVIVKEIESGDGPLGLGNLDAVEESLVGFPGEVLQTRPAAAQSLDEPLLRFVPRPKLGPSMDEIHRPVPCRAPALASRKASPRLIVTDVVAHADQALDIRQAARRADSAPSSECPWRAPPLASCRRSSSCFRFSSARSLRSASRLRPHAVPQRVRGLRVLCVDDATRTSSGAEVQHAG
jgi:hypothetical protein